VLFMSDKLVFLNANVVFFSELLYLACNLSTLKPMKGFQIRNYIHKCQCTFILLVASVDRSNYALYGYSNYQNCCQ